MKKILLMVLLAVFAFPELYGQCTATHCIQNIGTNPNQNNPLPFGQNMNSNTATTIAGWHIVSGVPIIGPGYGTSSGIEMQNGEEVYTCFTFDPNTKYRVCINAVVASTQTQGNLILEAHDGGSNSITIANSPFNSTTMQEVSFSFTTSTIPFTQLRVKVQSSFSTYSLSFDDIGVVEVPVVTATPMDACGTSTLSATTSSNKPVNVTWSPNDNLSSTTGNTVTARPCKTRTYTASYDSKNCFDGWTCTKEEQVTVVVNPDYNVAATPKTINSCGSSTLRATSTNPMTVTWVASSGEIVPPGNRVTVRPCETTTYTATFRCNNGCDYTKTVTVYVQQGTSVTASPPTITTCQSTTLTASSANPMSVTWSPATGLSSTHGNIVTASPCKTTKYYTTFTCSRPGLPNCVYSDSITVVVTPSGGIKDSGTSICYGPIDLWYVPDTPPCHGNTTYSWSGPQGPLSSTGPRFYKGSSTLSDLGIYTVIVTTAQGCKDTFTFALVKDCCDAIADFLDTGCSNPVRFINTTSTTNIFGTYGEWHWDFGDGTSSSIKNPSHLYTTHFGPTTVCLTVVLLNGPSTCCDKICKEIEVCDYGLCDAKAAFGYSVPNPGAFNVQFTDQSAGNGTACSWEWKVDGVLKSTAPNPLINIGPPPPPGPSMPPGATHLVCLKVGYCLPNNQTGIPDCYDEWCEYISVQ